MTEFGRFFQLQAYCGDPLACSVGAKATHHALSQRPPILGVPLVYPWVTFIIAVNWLAVMYVYVPTIKENFMADSTTPIRLLVYGGNGFVGSKVLELAATRGAICTSVSRSGKIPAQLERLRPSWLSNVTWTAGDALHPDPSQVASADAIVCLVGSPPLPTFNQRAFEQQVMINGSANSAVIAEAQRQGVKRLVLLSAHIPALMRSSRFGYYVGKQQAGEAAADYAKASVDNAATVIYPSAIYGKRYTGGGTAVPLGVFMSPVAWVMRCLPMAVSQFLPESPVRVQQVATSVVDAAMAAERRGLMVVENQDLLAM